MGGAIKLFEHAIPHSKQMNKRMESLNNFTLLLKESRGFFFTSLILGVVFS
jgi:hypothetical protein